MLKKQSEAGHYALFFELSPTSYPAKPSRVIPLSHVKKWDFYPIAVIPKTLMAGQYVLAPARARWGDVLQRATKAQREDCALVALLREVWGKHVWGGFCFQ